MGNNYRIINDIVKEYPDMLQIIIYHQSYAIPTGPRKTLTTKKKTLTTRQKELNRHRSIRRSKKTVQDIIISNKWDYWVTFTFSPKQGDRYSWQYCVKRLRLWLKRQTNLDYIIVPEKHKDGAYHFHGLIRNYTGTLKATKATTKNNQPIYKANYSAGRHQFVKITG